MQREFTKSINHCRLCRTRDYTSPKVYSQPCQTFKIEHFGKIVHQFQPLTIFTKKSILDV